MLTDKGCPACGKVGTKIADPLIAGQKDALYVCLNPDNCRVVEYTVQVKA